MGSGGGRKVRRVYGEWRREEEKENGKVEKSG